MTAAGCGDSSTSSVTTSINNSTTASSNGATATTASDAAPMTTAGSTGAMPTECQTYLNAVQACLDHVSTQNPGAVAQVRDTLEVNRGAIERLSHVGTPVEYCVSANNAWESRRGNFGC